MLAMRALYTGLLGGLITMPSWCNIYRSDVGKVCDAEQLSQSSLKANRSQVFGWIEKNVASSEAIILVHELEGKDAHGIATELRDEARKAGLTACALADQADLQAKDDDFHTDMVNLCSGNAPTVGGSVAVLDILAADDAERMREMQAWTTTNAKTPEALAVVAKVAAAQPRQRGAVLRAEAAKAAVDSCLMAGNLDTSQASLNPVNPNQVSPNFVVMKVEGGGKTPFALAHALVQQGTAAAIDQCYFTALAKTPTLQGKVAFKVTLDPLGKVVKAVDDSSAVKGPILQCLVPVLQQVSLIQPTPETGKKLAAVSGDASKAVVTLQLSTSTKGEGWGATIDPTWYGKNMPKKK